jgi:glycosyltransferase involved in cell wall biosynthesis
VTRASDVAVIIPAYRAAGVIGDALRSVADQTEAPGRVVVVVDDLDDEETRAAAEAWCTRLPLTVLTQENAGPAAARRRAIAACGEPLLALLDADDVWRQAHLEALGSAYDEHPGIVTADAVPWTPGRRSTDASRRSQFPVPPVEHQRVEILRKNFVFVGSLFSRVDYEGAGGFRDGFTGAEDWDLWIRMIRNGVPVHPAAGPTVMYRVVTGSLTRTAAIYDRYIAVLESALPGAATDEERTVIDARLKWLRARRHLALAQVAAREGRRGDARVEATQALAEFGGGRHAAEAVAMRWMPVTTVRVGDRLRGRRVR